MRRSSAAARRLDADRHYVGLITKNPVHPHWRVEWRRDEPYTLSEWADWLSFEDMRPDPSIETTLGVGRNVTVFDELLHIAYREVLAFKREGSLETWAARCLRLAIALNQQFPRAMKLSEVRAIAKSVAKWTWRHFARKSSPVGNRSAAGAKRWAGHIAERQTKPLETMGISESTYCRRKATGSTGKGLADSIAISDIATLGGWRRRPA